MKSSMIVIENVAGMHARPAGELVKIVKSFAPCTVKLKSSGREVNAASILSILSLGLKQGAEVEVTVESGDEAGAMDAVLNFIRTMN